MPFWCRCSCPARWAAADNAKPVAHGCPPASRPSPPWHFHGANCRPCSQCEEWPMRPILQARSVQASSLPRHRHASQRHQNIPNPNPVWGIRALCRTSCTARTIAARSAPHDWEPSTRTGMHSAANHCCCSPPDGARGAQIDGTGAPLSPLVNAPLQVTCTRCIQRRPMASSRLITWRPPQSVHAGPERRWR